MATLTFVLSNGSQQQAELRGELYVGRTAGNDVVLEDQGVSRQHCRFFVSEDGQAWVEDLNSANGVVVDGTRIAEPTPIGEGMEILLGPVHVSIVERRAAPRRPSTGRSAPSALAKRGGSAPRATRMIAASEMPSKRAKPLARSHGAEEPSTRAQLKGLSGPWAGQSFGLDKSRLLVGRTSPADVLLEDDSVSRRHAELYKSGSLISVRDLGSANGTFVNGERITERQLAPGDLVRFGVIELTYNGPGAPRGAGVSPKKKKLMLLGGVGAGLLLMLLVAGGLAGGPPAEDVGGAMGDGQPPPEEIDPLRLLGKCKAYADPEGESLDWAKAAEVCAKTLEADPALTEARSLERLAKKELGFEKLLEDAKLKIATSQDDDALEILIKIESDSSSFAKARAMFTEAAERVAKRKKTECRTDFKAAMYGQAVDSCRRFLEVTCNQEGEDEEVTRLFTQSARHSGKSSSFSCPAKYKAFGYRIVDSSAKAEAMIRDHYKSKSLPEPEIAQLILRYYQNGRPKQIADELKRIRVKKARVYGRRLDDVILLLDLVDGRYTSGQEGILRGDPVQAESYWKDAFEADGKLVPDKLRSNLAKDMGRQLADAYYKVGWDRLQKGNNKEAFVFFYKGYQHDKTNQEILMQLAGMERAAGSELRTNPSCESAQFAIEITMPESGVHKRALEVKQDYKCP